MEVRRRDKNKKFSEKERKKNITRGCSSEKEVECFLLKHKVIIAVQFIIQG